MRIVRFSIALLLIPVNIILTVGFIKNFLYFKEIEHGEIVFLAGVISYLLLHFILYRPVFMHVMAHELTHAFWAALFGGKVKSLNISHEGGSVTMDKSNFFVVLAPYFFPFYTVIALLIYAVVDRKYVDFIVFLIGLTYSFHAALTLYSLKQKQTDLKESGIIFSLMFIYFSNLLILSGIIALVSEQFNFLNFLNESWKIAEALIR
ncbi:MAG: M50 family metallopeptidase [Candidatus Firestonebacteria bacterium]